LTAENIGKIIAPKTGAVLNAALLLSSSNAALAAAPAGMIPAPQGNRAVSPNILAPHHQSWTAPAVGPYIRASGSAHVQAVKSRSSSSWTVPLLRHKSPLLGLSPLGITSVLTITQKQGSPSSFNLGGRGLSLDLASSATDVVLGAGLFKGVGSATITVGDVSKTFSAGQKVTAAEYLAIKEVLAGAAQTLTIDSAGMATGGDFSLNMVGSHTGLLVVPAGVTGIDNVSSGHGLSISGDILNYGSIYGLSTNSQMTVAGLSGKDIVNESGGIISTQIPGSLLNTLGSVNDANNLTITASNSVANAGTISAAGNINLVGAGGNIANSGSVISSGGNINLSAGARPANLNINASGGTFSANAGNINIATTGSGRTGAINMIGGDYYSNQLNISTQVGTITGNVGQVSGVVNTDSAATHFLADSTTLYLGNNAAKGDPTYVNTGGSIVIDGGVTAGEAITILASQDITVQAGSNASISTHQLSGDGSDITLVAGASVSTTGSSVGGPIPENAAIGSGTTATVSFSSGSGGNINLSGSTAAGPIIDTGSNNGNAGKVTLAAFANGATGGNIAVPAGTGGLSINTVAPSGNGGNVSIIAGANPSTAGTTVSIGGTIQTSGALQSGAVSIVTANPDSSDNSHNVTYNSNGAITSGNYIAAGTTVAMNAQISTADIITAGGGGAGAAQSSGAAGASGGNAGAILLLAGNGITTGNLLAYGGGGGGGEYENANGGAGGNGGSITLGTVANPTGSVTVTGQINSSGGGGGGATNATGGAGGLASAININATGQVLVAGAMYAGDGGAGESSPPSSVGAGGGGGGSFGGGGGGSGGSASGAGGGGGYFGGGGGGASSGGGGSGGGAFGVGAGGNGTNPGSAGVSNTGGAGSSGSGLSGGSLGNGGQGVYGGFSVPGLTDFTAQTQPLGAI
jgi:hypothetical protein